MKRAMKRTILAFMPLLIFAGLVTAFAIRLAHPPLESGAGNARVGQHVPNYVLPTLTTNEIVTNTNKNTAHMINFFASWCTPCLVEHPFFMEAKRHGISIIGIAYKDSPEQVKAYLEKNGNPYDVVLMDNDGNAGIQFGLTGVPETYLIDKDQTILRRNQGPFATLDDLRLWMQGRNVQ